MAQCPPENQGRGIGTLAPLFSADNTVAGSMSPLRDARKRRASAADRATMSPTVLIPSLAEGTFAFLHHPNN